MKKILFAALAATMLFASCDKENGTDIQNVVDAPAKLSIAFNNPVSKAYDDASEEKISSATVFVLSTDGAIMSTIVIPEGDLNDASIEYPVTTAANKVVVIANVDLSSLTFSTLAELKAEMATLDELEDAATNGFYASGTSSALVFNQTAEDGESKLATATVSLKLLPARLDVNITNSMDNYDGTKGLILDDVAVLYSGCFSHLVAATENGIDFYPSTASVVGVSGGKYFLSGFTGWALEDAQDDEYDILCRTFEADFEETYYVFPIAEGAYGRNTILAIRATWKGADGLLSPTETRYFPVHFNGDDAPVLESGKHYTLNITLNGDAGAGGGSITDPETPVVDAFINVVVSVEAWDVVTAIDKEFN